jgi:ParB family chromosome partitioning protein
VRDNVRELDATHVDNLAQSIALRGLLVPLIVRLTEAGYELVAGYHRIAACRKLDLPDAPVVVRDKGGSHADSAAENVTRKQLTPLEEAKAVQAISETSDIACYAKSGVIRSRGGSASAVPST